MPDGVKISQLDQVTDLTNSDLFPVCQPNAQSDTGYLTRRCNTLDFAYKVMGDIQYVTQLNTTVKTAWGAINELKAGVDASDKKYIDSDTISLSGATFACYITNDIITFTIPLSKDFDAEVNVVDIVDEQLTSFSIPNELTESYLSSLGDVEISILSGIGLKVDITNLVATPSTTGASVVHCESAVLSLSHEDES